jgi:hypothetical protein
MDDDDADYMQGSDDEVVHPLSAPWMVQLTVNQFHRIMVSTIQTVTKPTNPGALM